MVILGLWPTIELMLVLVAVALKKIMLPWSISFYLDVINEIAQFSFTLAFGLINTFQFD